MSSSAMWYKKGNFYEVPTTHIDFFLQNPGLLGFTQEEKEQLCIENGIPADSTTWLDTSQERSDILLEVLRRGAIRIRFYGGKTSVQCYDHNNKMNYRELQNCIIDGLGKCFGSIITVMDTFGWGEMLNDMGWGMQIKDFIASSVHKPQWNYIKSVKENGMNRNEKSIDTLFGKMDRKTIMNLIYSNCIENKRYVSIGKMIESNIRLYDLLKGKHAERGYVIISACRDSSNPNMRIVNQQKTNELKVDIRKSMFSYMPVYGGYVEDENGEVLEQSFIVFNYDRTGTPADFWDLKSFAIEMCGKYNQDSVLICEPGQVPKYYNAAGKVVSAPEKSSNNVKVNDMSQPYFTEFGKNKKRFTYDVDFPDEVTSSFIEVISSFDYFEKPPETYGERYRRYKLGELFL